MPYTYAHYTKDTNKVFYIGLGTRIDRLNRQDSRNQHWHNIVNKHGFYAKVLSNWDTIEEAQSHEKLLISCFKDMGYQLANKTSGGEGLFNPSDDVRKKLSDCQKGVAKSAEHRKKIAQTLTGKKLPDVVREKIRQGNLGKVMSEEARLKISKNSPYSKKIKCIETGIIYDSARDACKALGIRLQASNHLHAGAKVNKKRYGYHWESLS